MFILYFIVACKSPGRINKETVEFMKLLETYDATALCPDCEIIRTKRSRHCFKCGFCVERFDHHCPWLHNCIGLNNYKIYMVYLMT